MRTIDDCRALRRTRTRANLVARDPGGGVVVRAEALAAWILVPGR